MTTENLDSRYFVVLDSEDRCVAKYDTNAAVNVQIDEYTIVELNQQSDLDNYTYNDSVGYQ